MIKRIEAIKRSKRIEGRYSLISKLFYNQIHHTTLGKPIDDIHWGNNIIKEISNTES